jgi:hypothetical protein
VVAGSVSLIAQTVILYELCSDRKTPRGCRIFKRGHQSIYGPCGFDFLEHKWGVLIELEDTHIQR